MSRMIKGDNASVRCENDQVIINGEMVDESGDPVGFSTEELVAAIVDAPSGVPDADDLKLFIDHTASVAATCSGQALGVGTEGETIQLIGLVTKNFTVVAAEIDPDEDEIPAGLSTADFATNIITAVNRGANADLGFGAAADPDDTTAFIFTAFTEGAEPNGVWGGGDGGTTEPNVSIGVFFAGGVNEANILKKQVAPLECYEYALSDETSDLAVASGVLSVRFPFAFHTTEVRLSVREAPADGTGVQVAVANDGNQMFASGSEPQIDDLDKTSVVSHLEQVFESADIAADSEIIFDILKVGESNTGKGLKAKIIGYRTA